MIEDATGKTPQPTKATPAKRGSKGRRAGQVITRGDRVHLIRIFLGRDAEERKQNYNKTFRGTRKEAEKWLNGALVRKEKGEPLEASAITVNEYLDRWLAEAARPRLRDRTGEDYAALLERYVRPTIGKQQLAAVRSLELQSIYSSMLDRGLSARTVKYVHAVLSSAFKQAIKWQIIEKDITRLVQLPKQQRREMTALSAEQAGRFLRAVAADRYSVLFMLALESGMRPEEYLALKWSDLDRERRALSVQRVLIWKRGGGWQFEEPKTAKSRRIVPLSAGTMAKLIAHRRQQLEERMRMGSMWEENDLIFATETGTPIYPNNLRRRHFKPALVRAGCPYVRLYDLRHSTATLLLSSNVHPKVVSERLGHSSITLTLDTYSHVLPDMQGAATEKLENLLSAGVGTL